MFIPEWLIGFAVGFIAGAIGLIAIALAVSKKRKYEKGDEEKFDKQ